MGEARGKNGGTGDLDTRFWWGDLAERDHLQDLGIDGRIILKSTFTKWNGGIDWTDVTLDRNMWQARVNVVTTFGFLEMREISCLAKYLLASQEGICSMELGTWFCLSVSILNASSLSFLSET